MKPYYKTGDGQLKESPIVQLTDHSECAPAIK